MRKPARSGPVAIYRSELSEGSRRTMRFSALRAGLAARLAPNTANKILSAVKGVCGPRGGWVA